MNADLMAKATDKLFMRLAATYGASWDASLGQSPIGAVKAVWMHELSRYAHSLRRVSWALDNLPERCPNAIQFRHLCAAAPDIEAPMLAAPPATDPALVARELAKIPVAIQGATDHKAWAKRLQARELAGEKLGMAQKTMYRAALGIK